MGNSSNFREAYIQQEQLGNHFQQVDFGELSTGLARRENGLELSFDRIDADRSDIIEEIRRESVNL